MDLTIRPREAGETAKEFAYRVLRDNICSLGLAPGEAVGDQEIAGLLGISRTPVREAIIQLKNESEIIEVFPQSGMKVALITTIFGIIRCTGTSRGLSRITSSISIARQRSWRSSWTDGSIRSWTTGMQTRSGIGNSESSEYRFFDSRMWTSTTDSGAYARRSNG